MAPIVAGLIFLVPEVEQSLSTVVFPEKLTVSPMICVQLWPLPETPVPLKLTPSI